MRYRKCHSVRDEIKFVHKCEGDTDEAMFAKNRTNNLQALEKDFLNGEPRLPNVEPHGGLEQKTEYVVGTQSPEPFFKLRDLGSSTAATMEKDVKEIEDAFVELHKKFEMVLTEFTQWW